MFNKFPYTNFHDLNANWLIKKLKELTDTVSELTTGLDQKIIAAIAQLLPWSVSNGGTGSNNPAGARFNLDVYSKQQVDDALPSMLNPLPVNKGGTGSISAGTARLNLDVYSKSEVDALIPAFDDPVTVAHGGTGAATASGARTNLDVYSKSEVDALIPAFEDPVTVAHGGTGATTAAGARTNLSVYSGSEVDTLLNALLKISVLNSINYGTLTPAASYAPGISLHPLLGSSEPGDWPNKYGIVITFKPSGSTTNRTVQLCIPGGSTTDLYRRNSSNNDTDWTAWIKHAGTLA